MDRQVYARMAELEDRHWWFAARRRILTEVLARLVALPAAPRLLEAGCGTGGNLAIEGITSFSTVPLRVWSYVGFTISLFAFAYALFLIFRTLVMGTDVPGYASLMVVVLFMGGINLLTLGIIGEYLGRTYMEVKGRPLYLIRERHGFGPEELLNAVDSMDRQRA